MKCTIYLVVDIWGSVTLLMLHAQHILGTEPGREKVISA
jgi:hypothetical protein